MVDLTVKVLVIVIARWRCSHCRYVFTDYPPFVFPYRRYASDSLLPLARNYVEQDSCSYQQAVSHSGGQFCYDASPGQKKYDGWALNRSTLWRFLLFLGTQTATLQTGLQLWLEHDPLSTLHRFSGTVAPHKYRSSPREEILRHARRLLHLVDHWNRAFAEPFFPRFATRSRPP